MASRAASDDDARAPRSPMPRVGQMLVAMLLAVLVACGPGGRQLGAQPSWRQGGEVAGPPGGRSQQVVFAPSAPAVEWYNDPPVAPAPASPLGDAIVAAVNEAAIAAGKAPLIADGRLFAAADELAAVVGDDTALAYPMVEFALQRHGIVEPSPHLVVIWGPLAHPAELVAQLRERLPELLAEGGPVAFNRVGIGASPRGANGEGVAILALQASSVELAPIPRIVERGAAVRLEGRLLGDFREPEVFVASPDGTVARLPAATSGVSGFRAELICAERAGRHQVEITGVDATGSTVLANFPVWCDQAPPTSVTIEITDDDRAPPATTALAEARMLALLNRDRVAGGLPALAVDARVVAVARAHSQAMKDTGLVAHVSPTTGSASDRVRAAGIKTGVVLENVARAYGVIEAQEGLMNSPGHRANILSPHPTHVGIGITFGEEVAGRREMFVTQVFTRVPPRIDAASVVRELRAGLERVAELRWDDDLGDLAASFAVEIARGGSAENVSKQGTAAANAMLANRFQKLTTVVTTVADLAAFSPESALSDKSSRVYGVGVGQGNHDVLGEQAIFIVLILAQDR